MNSYEFISLIFKCSLRNCFKFSSVSLYDSFFYYAMPSKYKLSRLYLSSRSRSFFHHYSVQLNVPYWCYAFECYLISKVFQWCHWEVGKLVQRMLHFIQDQFSIFVTMYIIELFYNHSQTT